MNNYTLVAALVALFVFGNVSSAQVAATATAATPADIAKSGELTATSYRNRVLKFTLALPNGWEFASEDVNKNIIKEGAERMKENETAARQRAFERSMAKTVVLFSLSRYPMSDGRNTAQLVSGYEQVPASLTAQSYAESNKRLVVSKMGAGRVLKDVHNIRIGGRDVTAFDVEGETNGVTISQKYYVMARGGGMLFWIITWVNGGEEERKILENAVASMKFE